jgi:hypothetical protein
MGSDDDSTTEIPPKWHRIDCDCGYSEKIDGTGSARKEGMAHEDDGGLGHQVTITRVRDGVQIHP